MVFLNLWLKSLIDMFDLISNSAFSDPLKLWKILEIVFGFLRFSGTIDNV
jgi:hypothetical protein